MDDYYVIDPLIIAVVLKTYDYLTNVKKIRIYDGKKKEVLKTALTINAPLSPASLPARLFNIVCHFQYENITKENVFGIYYNTTLLGERMFCTIMQHINGVYDMNDYLNYLNTLYVKLYVLGNLVVEN